MTEKYEISLFLSTFPSSLTPFSAFQNLKQKENGVTGEVIIQVLYSLINTVSITVNKI